MHGLFVYCFLLIHLINVQHPSFSPWIFLECLLKVKFDSINIIMLYSRVSISDWYVIHFNNLILLFKFKVSSLFHELNKVSIVSLEINKFTLLSTVYIFILDLYWLQHLINWQPATIDQYQLIWQLTWLTILQKTEDPNRTFTFKILIIIKTQFRI